MSTPMQDERIVPRRMALLGLVVIGLTLPACHGDGSESRLAYKPVPTSLRGRPFYVSGYAGADYSPARPRRRDPASGGGTMVVPGVPEVTVRQGTWDEP